MQVKTTITIMTHHLHQFKLFFFCLFLGLLAQQAAAQSTGKRPLEIEQLTSWREITASAISNNGRWVVYTLDAEDGDPTTVIYDGQTKREIVLERADDFRISNDSRFVILMIHPVEDTVKDMRRRKVDKNELPGDTLAIYSLSDLKLSRIPEVKSYQLPEKWDGWIAYLTLPEAPATDSTQEKRPKKGSKKKEYERLVIQELGTARQWSVDKVKEYQLAEEAGHLAWITEGRDSTVLPGVYHFSTTDQRILPLYRGKGTFKRLTFDKKGSRLAFVGDVDTTKARVQPYGLYYYGPGRDSAVQSLAAGTDIMKAGWTVSEYARLRFSDDGSKLFFGLAPPPILADTSILDEEIAQVEVWTSNDGRLYTQQNVQLNQDKRKAYMAVMHTASGKAVQLADETMPDVEVGDEGNAPVALGSSELPYEKMSSWQGGSDRDVYRIDLLTGQRKKLTVVAHGNPNVSPAGKYFYWYSAPDSSWMVYSIAADQARSITDSSISIFYNELNDEPDYPASYQLAGWFTDDASVIINDRYDLWQIDPSGRKAPVRLTKGREEGFTYRYIRLDTERRFIEPGEKILLHRFNEQNKEHGYAWLDLSSGRTTLVQAGKFALSRRPLKAKNAERYVYTREDFRTFPDLLYGTDLAGGVQISRANPQQKDFIWGNIELYEWTSLDGQQLQGLLVKPDNFDPKKKYPMIVNFYERSSDGLYSHRAPQANRSTINYSYYTSRGYVVFNPDIPYRIGYPGESCYNAVMPGITNLLADGYIDRDRIGVQGHSWGGYQIAYLLTKTNIFRCAEAGAPVVNMISAYGGIRWGTGVSRMFQYEHTQSRIGGTLWEYPLRFLENSPIFEIDKINTPVLIMHNDNDSAVPWYQGIEFFTAMRRLDKKAWMLNYNGEPHWPVKLANRKDFQRRMSQFFDHYLMDTAMPSWMERGVPAIEKGILQGY